jgi:nitroreductase
MPVITAERCSESPSVTADEVAVYVVSAAVWAPSVHNTQPWWFGGRGAEIILHADGQRQLTVADPAGREMLISCGAALFTAKLALRSLGYIPETRLLPDPADPLVVARLRWRHRAPPTEHESRLFAHVPRRRSHRGGFGPLPLPPGLLPWLRQDAIRDQAAMRVAMDDASRAAVAAVVETAEQVERRASAYVREISSWAPPPGSARRDGVSPLSYPARPVHTSPDFPGRDFAHGHGWGLPESSAATGGRFAGVVALLTTQGDQPADWINAGHALQRMLLTSATWGVAAALYSQPVEIDWLREVLRAQLGDGSYPQLVLRLGITVQSAISLRRAADSVLFHGDDQPFTSSAQADTTGRPATRDGRRDGTGLRTLSG